MSDFRFHGSLTASLRATRRNIRRHSEEVVKHAFAGYWASVQHATGRPGIPVLTGATRRSALPWVRTPAFRRIPRGPSYGPRDVGEARRVLGSWKLGDRMGVSVQHPGGILARNFPFRSGPRAGQLPSRKVRAGKGFHIPGLEEAQSRFDRAGKNFRPEGPRG